MIWFFNIFFGILTLLALLDRHSEDWQESGGKDRGEGMQQEAMGRTQTRGGRFKARGIWSPAHLTELNRRP